MCFLPIRNDPKKHKNKILTPTQSRDNPANLFMFMCFFFPILRRLFWGSRPGGPKAPFALSLSTFGHIVCLTLVRGRRGNKKEGERERQREEEREGERKREEERRKEKEREGKRRQKERAGVAIPELTKHWASIYGSLFWASSGAT